MFESILRNEFRNFSGQELSDEEYTALLDYLEYYDDGEATAKDLHCMVGDFLEECYKQNEWNPDHPEDPEYVLLDWWLFPMAKREYPDEHTTIITYRGCKMTSYKP